ncbi:MAG TPA: VOC family protein [Flavobacterium sp.]|jgi:predicted 3-demethylubiquinone-9 3-methyltransferase (glyoxalase superfamily)|nr:VOC family protein [Flavobacterium sp.]
MENNKMKICLWFESQAEEAANFYSTIFPNTKIGKVLRYSKEAIEIHKMPEGSVMTVEFSINDMDFIGINGGPVFKFNEAISVMVSCDTQEEIDNYWSKLTVDGEELPCGWCKDKYGLVWQIAPTILHQMLSDSNSEKVQRVTHAYMQMKKFDIVNLEKAFAGN